MKTLSGLLVAALALCLAGCGVGEVEDEATLVNDGDELSATAQLLGSYKASEGTLLGLVLHRDGTKKAFSADQQVYCFRAPCYPIHWDGTWTMQKSKLYLTEGGSKHVYKYVLADGVLTLSDPATDRQVGVLHRVDTWCGETADCDLQQWEHPMGMGGPVCTAQQTCGWYCGGLPYPGGLGDDCSAGQACTQGTFCDNGTCRPVPVVFCDLFAEKSCGDAQVCTATAEAATCQAFAHGVAVGMGYPCGGSIGVSCADGLGCEGLPSGSVGGTGTCR